MIRNPRPTRAEASDVANAIFDGTDAIMLSGESAAGKYPVRSVETMARIARETEDSISYTRKIAGIKEPHSNTATEAISYASCETAVNLEAQAIITATGSGLTARKVAKYRPPIKIVAVTPNARVQHFLTLSWGVYPLVSAVTESTDEMIENATQVALEKGLVQDGDMVIITAGAPVGIPGTTNLIKVDVVGKPVIEGMGVGKKIVVGTVVRAETAREANAKVNKGDILVTRMTDKEYMPAMKKATAVITAEGGLTSHPAVVGLNLGKPVVVGAGNKIEELKDGEEITLDGARGLVYRGKAHLR